MSDTRSMKSGLTSSVAGSSRMTPSKADYVNMDDFLKWKQQFEEDKQSHLNSLMTPR